MRDGLAVLALAYVWWTVPGLTPVQGGALGFTAGLLLYSAVRAFKDSKP